MISVDTYGDVETSTSPAAAASRRVGTTRSRQVRIDRFLGPVRHYHAATRGLVGHLSVDVLGQLHGRHTQESCTVARLIQWVSCGIVR